MEVIGDFHVPYGSKFEVIDPATKLTITGTTFRMLFNAACASRKANSVPEGLGFREEVMDWVCQKYPQECKPVDFSRPKTSLSLSDVLRGTHVLVAFKLAGSPLVDSKEAERRAGICAQCKLNVAFPKPCGGLCGELKTMVDTIIGNVRTPTDNSNKSCAICRCYTSAHVWLPLDILDKGLTDDMRKQFKSVPDCWKKSEL